MNIEYRIRYALKLGIRLIISAAVGAILAIYTIKQGESGMYAAVVGISSFLITALIAGVLPLLAPGWDGVVTNKTVRYRVTQSKNSVPEYELVVKDPRGREHRDVFLDEADDGSLNRVEYYDHGERVRRHRGYKYLEKFDKSGKNLYICINCGTLNYKTRNRCVKCSLPLLRDNIVQ